MSEPVGRPPRWKSGTELQSAVDAYFADCDAKEKPPGIYGLADFTNQDPTTIYEYETGIHDSEGNEFSRILNKARLKVAAYAEGRVYSSPAGAISQLVNITRKLPNPYKNSQHNENTGTMTLELGGIAGLLTKASE